MNNHNPYDKGFNDAIETAIDIIDNIDEMDNHRNFLWAMKLREELQGVHKG